MFRLVLLLAFAFTAINCCSCSCSSGPRGYELGKWKSPDGNVTLEFTRKGEMITTIGNASVHGTYKWLNDAEIEVDMPVGNGVSQKETRGISIKDKTLALTDKNGRTTTFAITN